MLVLPVRLAGLVLALAPLFGAILTPGRTTVTGVLRIMGRVREPRFVDLHRILTRAAWCPRSGSRILLTLLIDAFAPRGSVVLALDNTIERLWGRRIRARGLYRDTTWHAVVMPGWYGTGTRIVEIASGTAA